MMLLRDINDNILIPNLSCFDVYQDEAKNESSAKTNWGLESNKKTEKGAVRISPIDIWNLKMSTHCAIKWLLGVVGFFIIKY